MIFISAGMPRAGTAWFFNMINSLIIDAGYDDIRELCDRYNLGDFVLGDNCRVGKTTFSQMNQLISLDKQKHTFVIKTHSSPVRFMRLLTRGHAKPVYIFRDPRDCAVSAYEIGQKLRDKGDVSTTFTEITSMDEALRRAAGWCRIYARWKAVPRVELVRYEDLRGDTIEVMGNLMKRIGLDLSYDLVVSSLKPYLVPDAVIGTRTHFNKGVVGRYREHLDERQIESFNKRHATILKDMGYKTDQPD